ncbi:glycosyltransferase family 2 protein [Mongoliimonas terrestris]|uniref:glycosyltransferase family 2 protein n=1 Tax=Mongoliimonas terrestris TaxID=1709001 RepID=UPI0009497DE1|nr:glycosyltransferase [Mongoliimonas terrestris]
MADRDLIAAETDQPVLGLLCAEVALVVWTLPAQPEESTAVEGSFGEPIGRSASVRLPLADGRVRVVVALPRPAEAQASLIVRTGMAGARVEVQAVRAESRVVDPVALFRDLAPPARLSLAAALLDSWPSLFRLKTSRSYAAFAARLARTLAGERANAPVVARTGGMALVEVAASAPIEKLKACHLVSAAGVQALKADITVDRRAVEGRRTHRLLVDLPDAPGGDEWLVLRADQGLLVRRLVRGDRDAALETWWRNRPDRDPGLREWIIAALDRRSAPARAAAVEFQLRCPIEPRRVVGGQGLPAAQVELAVSSSAGLLASGWFRDPGRFVSRLYLLDAGETPRPLDDTLHTYPGFMETAAGDRQPATGFTAFVPGARAPLLQPRFLLELKSGARHLLVPEPQPVDVGEARALALRAVPPQALDDQVLAGCLAPVLGDLQRRLVADIGTPTVRRIGTPVERPLASLVIPLYKVMDFLKFQVAAFASDPQIAAKAEIIYVLDSPEQAEEVDHLLTGLHLVYGLPLTLVVMPRNGGYAPACNRGAAVARGALLALLNSDVIPIEPGWLGMLAQRLGRSGVGAVGPKLLFEDDSIQHAGMYFARDHRGRWHNHHFHKGMPRHYAPADAERDVPAITGACVVTTRALFERVGGFTEDYVIGDYEDSDLCLKMRAEGQAIRYVPAAELYHLERRSIKASTDYMRGVTSQYNSWLHACRWGDTMQALMVPTGTRPSVEEVAA